MARIDNQYTAIVRQDGAWWIGWVEEVPGVNSQGHTRAELIENLRSALREAIEMNREAALAEAGEAYAEELIPVWSAWRCSCACGQRVRVAQDGRYGNSW